MKTNNLTNLSEQRTRAAAERTLLAWIRNTLALLGLGIVISHISNTSEIFVQNFPKVSQNINLEGLRIVGLLSIALALVLLALATWQYIAAVRSLRRPDYVLLPAQPLEIASTAAVLIYGLIALCTLFLKFP